MFHFLEQLRKKPLAYRKRVLLLITSSITGIIFLIWLSTFSVVPMASDVDKTTLENQMKPIEEIKTSVGSFIDEVKTMTSGIFGTATDTPPAQIAQ